MRLYGILPSSRTEHVPVPRLPASNVRHGRDGHAPHASAADRLVLGDLSLCHGQTRHFCRPAESYAEHLLWAGVVSFARKMARLCSRGCRLLKTSPAARSSRSLTKLLRRAQKSNATATDSIAEKPAIKSSCAWQEPSLHLVLSCIKPISTYKENGRPKANTHKDNNEIPLRAKEVLPGNRKDFSFVQNSAGLHPRPEDAV